MEWAGIQPYCELAGYAQVRARGKGIDYESAPQGCARETAEWRASLCPRRYAQGRGLGPEESTPPSQHLAYTVQIRALGVGLESPPP